jgi:hypothetical protein
MRETRRRRTLGRLALLVCWLAGWSLLVAQTCPPPPIQYIYDENGRLIAVVDPSVAPPAEGVAIYDYDAVGNITAIRRQTTSTVSVLSFSPPCAPAGSTVQVYGTGFDPTPGEQHGEVQRCHCCRDAGHGDEADDHCSSQCHHRPYQRDRREQHGERSTGIHGRL